MFTQKDRNLLYAVAAALGVVYRQGEMIMAGVEDITKAVEDLTVAVDSVEDTLEAAPVSGGADPAAVQQVVDAVSVQTNRLNAAVAAYNERKHAAGM